jgi:hypothetical protein
VSTLSMALERAPMKLDDRPTVGRLTVPFMVDETRSPIVFKEVDRRRIAQCATEGRCGICGGKLRRGPVAFIGPDDARSCFADPWMHPACAQLAMAQCPFLAGRRGFREGADALTQRYEDGMVNRPRPQLALAP